MNIRTFYDLKKMEKLTWDPVHTPVHCVKESFTGAWSDPFEGADDLTKQGAKQLGTETLHGFTTKVLQTASDPNGSIKAWVDTKTNLVVKAQFSPAGGAPITMVEVTDVSLSPPPASAFAIPSDCAAAASPASMEPPRPPCEVDEIAALTGGNAKDYLNGIYGPGSKTSCTMIFRRWAA
jgi:hypothetical protein